MYICQQYRTQCFGNGRDKSSVTDVTWWIYDKCLTALLNVCKIVFSDPLNWQTIMFSLTNKQFYQTNMHTFISLMCCHWSHHLSQNANVPRDAINTDGLFFDNYNQANLMTTLTKYTENTCLFENTSHTDSKQYIVCCLRTWQCCEDMVSV